MAEALLFAVPASSHHYSIVVLFLIGYLLHVGLQVDAIARAKGNLPNARRKIFEQSWIRMAFRLFVSLMIFIYVWHEPAAIPKLLGYFGISPNETVTAILTVPMSPPVAGLFGCFWDTVLAFIPGLKNAVPTIDGNGGAP